MFRKYISSEPSLSISHAATPIVDLSGSENILSVILFSRVSPLKPNARLLYLNPVTINSSLPSLSKSVTYYFFDDLDLDMICTTIKCI